MLLTLIGLSLAAASPQSADAAIGRWKTETRGGIVEIQGTAEHGAFTRPQMDQMVDLAAAGIRQLFALQRTAIINRFRWHLHRIDPTLDPTPRSLDRSKTRAWLREVLADLSGIDARLAAIEPGRQFAVFGAVAFDVGIEQQDA